MLVADAEGTRGEAYNCASGITVTINQLAEMVKKSLGREDLETRIGRLEISNILKYQMKK